jgi:ElaB/YqjD/DUF883 family membrane-anchored ribosome-binding protein
MMRAFSREVTMAKETPFDRARDFVEEKIDKTKEVLGDSYSKARDQFDDVSEDVRKSVKATAKRLESDYGYLWDDARDYVRENPGTAVAISAAVGFLLGFLLRGNDD